MKNVILRLQFNNEGDKMTISKMLLILVITAYLFAAVVLFYNWHDKLVQSELILTFGGALITELVALFRLHVNKKKREDSKKGD